jgi:purine-binding chemotaxis protein CheW
VQLSRSLDRTAKAVETRQFLTFAVGEEEFGVDILKVQEIRGYSAITPIPNAPGDVLGVMNLRGTVVPVIGLREKLCREALAYDKFTVIIVFDVGGVATGLIVDAVTDVLDVPEAEIEVPPTFGGRVDTTFVAGLVKTTEKLVVLLDIERVLGPSDLAGLS